MENQTKASEHKQTRRKKYKRLTKDEQHMKKCNISHMKNKRKKV